MFAVVAGIVGPIIIIAVMLWLHRRLEARARARQAFLAERLERMKGERDALYETICQQNTQVNRRSRETIRAMRQIINAMAERD